MCFGSSSTPGFRRRFCIRRLRFSIRPGDRLSLHLRGAEAGLSTRAASVTGRRCRLENPCPHTRSLAAKNVALPLIPTSISTRCPDRGLRHPSLQEGCTCSRQAGIPVQLRCPQATLGFVAIRISQCLESLGQSPEVFAHAVSAQLHCDQLPEEHHPKENAKCPNYSRDMAQKNKQRSGHRRWTFPKYLYLCRPRNSFTTLNIDGAIVRLETRKSDRELDVGSGSESGPSKAGRK